MIMRVESDSFMDDACIGESSMHSRISSKRVNATHGLFSILNEVLTDDVNASKRGAVGRRSSVAGAVEKMRGSACAGLVPRDGATTSAVARVLPPVPMASEATAKEESDWPSSLERRNQSSVARSLSTVEDRIATHSSCATLHGQTEARSTRDNVRCASHVSIDSSYL